MVIWCVLWVSACVTATSALASDDAPHIPVSVSILRYKAVLDELEASSSQRTKLNELVASFDRENKKLWQNAKQAGRSGLPANPTIEQVLAFRASPKDIFRGKQTSGARPKGKA